MLGYYYAMTSLYGEFETGFAELFPGLFPGLFPTSGISPPEVLKNNPSGFVFCSDACVCI